MLDNICYGSPYILLSHTCHHARHQIPQNIEQEFLILNTSVIEESKKKLSEKLTGNKNRLGFTHSEGTKKKSK